MNYSERMLARLETQRQKLEAAINNLINLIQNGKLGGEDERIWLDQFAKGRGLDICCGDFLIGDAEGVDGDHRKIGTTFLFKGDELTFQKPGSLDFVVTNYLEAFPDPLKALNEWYRVLKPGGTLALVCRNADASPDEEGPLKNRHRVSTFSPSTLKSYLKRAGFSQVSLASVNAAIRARAVK